MQFRQDSIVIPADFNRFLQLPGSKFIGACVKVPPTKKIADLPVSSVVKRLRDKAFARSVDRSTIYGGAQALEIPLEEHIAFTIEALKPIGDEIGL